VPGGGTNNPKKTYDTVTTPALSALIGKKPVGTWTLVVQDKEKLDTGTIRSITPELGFWGFGASSTRDRRLSTEGGAR